MNERNTSASEQYEAGRSSASRRVYVSPGVLRLGTPAEICQVSKTRPRIDSVRLSNPQPFPGEFAS